MRFHAIPALFLCLLAGCLHPREARQRPALSPDAPAAAEVLADLAGQRAGLDSLQSIAMIRLRLPGEAATQNFRTGFIQYEAPDRFFVQGRKPGFLVRVYIEGERFLVDVPSEKTIYYGREGDVFPEGLLDIAPSDLFRALFFLDLPDADAAARTDVVAYDPASRTVTLEVRPVAARNGAVRRIQAIKDGAWRVSDVTRFDNAGAPVAVTECRAWDTVDSHTIPVNVITEFPGRDGAEVEYDLRVSSTQVNGSLRPVAPLDQVRVSLVAEGYHEVRGQTP